MRSSAATIGVDQEAAGVGRLHLLQRRLLVDARTECGDRASAASLCCLRTFGSVALSVSSIAPSTRSAA
jgi:hypothetical protein